MFRKLVAISFLMIILAQSTFADQQWCKQTDVFPVKMIPKILSSKGHVNNNLEVLWVIDDSSSMQEYQELLKKNFRYFFKAFEPAPDIHYRMQLFTTSARPVMDDQTWRPIQIFSDSPESDRSRFIKKLLVGTQGNPKERGAKAVLNFVSSQKKSVFDGSYLMINVLTDEDDESSSRDVKAMRSKLSKLVEKGNQISINLISFSKSVKRYHENFVGFELNFYPISNDHFSWQIKKMGARAIGNTVLDLNLQNEPIKVESVRHLGPSSELPVLQYQWEGDDRISVDLGMIPTVLESTVEVTYQHACPDYDRIEANRLIKKVADIDFFANSDVFTDPVTTHASIDEVSEFLKKNEQARIKLIGAVSYSGNPLVWLKMKLKDREDFTKAHLLTQARANRIASELKVRGIHPDRIEAHGSYPGFHRHWYSYLLDASMIDLVSDRCFACDIESDRRVIMKIR